MSAQSSQQPNGYPELKLRWWVARLLIGTICLLTLHAQTAGAQNSTYWVSPSGQAAWGSCRSETPLDDVSACSLQTANRSATAGDTVYLRGGVYLMNAIYDAAIKPSNSGACDSPPCTGGVGARRIMFSNYGTERPILRQASLASTMMGFDLNGKSWIAIRGIVFHNFTFYLGWIRAEGSYNEVSYSEFVSDPGWDVGSGLVIGDFAAPSAAVHNYVHHNYFSRRRHQNPCAESVDMIRVGNNIVNPWSADDFNTIAYNYIEYASHSTLFTNGLRNVIVGNTFHNEPWIEGCESWKKSVSTSTLQVGTGSRTLVTAAGLDYAAGQPISVVASSDYSVAMKGFVSSYSTTTGSLTFNSTAGAGTGSYSSWILSQGLVPKYDTATYDGRYGHRNVAIGDENHYVPNRNLVEGNRIGFASTNPGNGGSSNLDFESPGNIGRYNVIYGGLNSGIYFKWAHSFGPNTGGVSNHVYNNTVVGNGQGWNAALYGGKNLAYNGQGIAQLTSGGLPSGNVIKNNLVYGNGQGDICELGWRGPSCSPAAFDQVAGNWTTANGNPGFVNPDLSQPRSQGLLSTAPGYSLSPVPNLMLTAGSPAIDQGLPLTQATSAGSSSTTLVVDDAGYFQDGTLGSDLARGISFFPDWIAVGTPTNQARVRSVNVTTKTIVLDTPLSWSFGAPVWLARKSDGSVVLVGSAPDPGAHEGPTVPQAPTGLRVVP